jgi:hypothetical protein
VSKRSNLTHEGAAFSFELDPLDATRGLVNLSRNLARDLGVYTEDSELRDSPYHETWLRFETRLHVLCALHPDVTEIVVRWPDDAPGAAWARPVVNPKGGSRLFHPTAWTGQHVRRR